MNTARARLALLTYGCVLVTAIMLSILFSKYTNWNLALASPFGKHLWMFTQAFIAFNAAIFIWWLVLALRYRPALPCTDEELPRCTVIVPAYNEGRQVFDTILSISKSDYPKDKLTVIGVDDGSSDDTWDWLCEAQKELGGWVRLHKQPMNRGKRHALEHGFREGDGEVYVTIDSDSMVEPHTLRHIVSPFVRNKQVGGVAGNVRILNIAEGIIPKMLEVSFAYSFDFIRAGQSVVNSVLCTPGALSAYRREVVMKVLDEWVNQTFMGRQANIGEDRAMTNLILRSGYYVHYQRDAVVFTAVPITFVKLWKMMLRWARSNVRESLVIAKFAFRHFRDVGGSLGMRIYVFYGLLGLTLGQMMHVSLLIGLILMPLAVGPKMMLGAVISSLIPGIFYAIRYRSNKALWALPYSFFWVGALSWISLYAIFTPHKNGWMTRDLAQKQVQWTPPQEEKSFAVHHP